MKDTTLQSIRRNIQAMLAAHRIANESDYLLSLALQQTRAWIYANPSYRLNAEEKICLQTLVDGRLDGTPLAYLRTNQEFYGLSFEINRSVLIPRPETEVVVAQAIALLPKRGCIIDLGSGCGNIAVAIAHCRPDASVTASDLSCAALELAKRNAARHGCQVRLIQSDWYNEIDECFDLIVSNPPYIARGDSALCASVAQSEPPQALYADENGRGALRQIIEGAPAHLNQNGWIVVEHGWRQASAVVRMMQQVGFKAWRTVADDANHARCTYAQL